MLGPILPTPPTGQLVLQPAPTPSPRPETPGGALRTDVRTENYLPGVDITGNGAFIAGTRANLETIATTESGRRLLDDIGRTGHTVTITPDSSGSPSTSYPMNDAPRFVNPATGTPGAGVSATVEANPGPFVMYDGSEPWMRASSDTVLFHEMNHARQAGMGIQVPGQSPNPLPAPAGGNPNWRPTQNSRELQGTGLGPWANDPVTENSYRAERGDWRREWY